MEGTITIPGAGPVKKQTVYIVGGIAVGIVAFAWWRSASAPPAEEEIPVDEAFPDQVVDTPGGIAGTPPPVGSTDIDLSTMPDSNDEWVRAATDRLADIGFDAGAVTTALGRYITRQPLTKDQQDMVRAAIGQMGNPPAGDFSIVPMTEPAPSALTEPTGLKVTGTGTTTVDLAWNAVPGASGYRVYRGGVSQNVAASSDTKAQIGGLQPGKSYTFTVAAQQAGGEKTGPRSRSVSAKTKSVVLKAPTGLRVAKTGKTSASLTWNKVPGADGYRMYHDKSSGNVGASGDGKGTVYGLKPNTTYRFHVRALDSNGNLGPSSATASGKTKK